MLKLMYITNDATVASIAEKYGVDVIWIDLETLGKAERQHGMDTVQSRHCPDDISAIKPVLKKSRLMVRVNPWNARSVEEIDDVIARGADMVMLPMWKTVGEVKNFTKAINNRAVTVLLLETKEAAECLDEVLKIKGIDRIHIGLNDLHLSYGLTFMFELITNGMVEKLCNQIRAAGISYGFGGIAAIGEGALPAEKILLEHYRLGSSAAILSRSFCNWEKCADYAEVESIFSTQMKKLRDFELNAETVSVEKFAENKKETERCVAEIVRKIKIARGF